MLKTNSWKESILALLLMAAALGTTWICYAPGLTGSFLFDDFANLPSLGSEGSIKDSDSLWRYLTSGNADPTGRPVALASFLIDAQDWPAPPRSFKVTNLLVHLLNGVLLAALLRKLGQALIGSPYAPNVSTKGINLAAVIGAAVWLLHPLFVSTTLYIVQREAMLPATFTLAGLMLWLKGRDAFRANQPLKGYAWLLVGLGACTLLAVLSKANGALLPALALVIEYVFLRHVPDSRIGAPWNDSARKRHQLALGLIAGIPSMLVASYLLYEGWHGLTYGISDTRPWTLAQRLLTEPRVLFEYLRLIWFPRPFTAGVFNDQFQASSTLWDPPSTLLTVVGLIVLLVAGWRMRSRRPALALAIMFYFVGQCMESSTIALELYFEHRNYLPAMLMLWPLALWLCHIPPNAEQKPSTLHISASIRLLLGLCVIIGLAWMTYARASLWGNERDQALLWAKLNPASGRAQAYAAQSDMNSGRPDLAVARLTPWLEKNPDQVQLALNLLAARCQMGGVEVQTFEQARTALASTRDPGSLLASWFGRAIDQAKTPICPQMDLAGIETLLQAATSNPHLMATPGRRQDLYHLRGRIALERHTPSDALASFNLALDQQVTPTIAFEQAAVLGSAGYPEQGLKHLDYYEASKSREFVPSFGMASLHAWVLRRQRYWDKELVRLRQTLRSDVQSASPSAGSA